MESYWFVFVTIFLVALVQIPIGVDLLRFMFPEWRIARLASRAAQSILFTVMGTIFCIGLGYHLFVYLPLIAEDPLHSIKGILHLTFALWVWINIVVNYYMAVFIHPGRETSQSSIKEAEMSSKAAVKNGTPDERSVEGLNTAENRGLRSRVNVGDDQGRTMTSLQTQSRSTTRPTSGVEWKPNRNQRCKICQCEIPYMDHHCPFTGSCVGLHNYSHFFIGLLYGVIGLGYAVAITLPYFYQCNLKNVLWFFGLVEERGISEVCLQLGPHSHIFLPVFAGLCLSWNMFFLQVVFLLADLSTYNVLKKWSKYPMFRFAWQRMCARKYLDPESRLRVLITSQRRGVLWYLVPVRNSGRTSYEQ